MLGTTRSTYSGILYIWCWTTLWVAEKLDYGHFDIAAASKAMRLSRTWSDYSIVKCGKCYLPEITAWKRIKKLSPKNHLFLSKITKHLQQRIEQRDDEDRKKVRQICSKRRMREVGNSLRVSHHQIVRRRKKCSVPRAALRVRILVDEKDFIVVIVVVAVEVELRRLVNEAVAKRSPAKADFHSHDVYLNKTLDSFSH